MMSCSLKVAALNQCAPTASCYIQDRRPVCVCDFDKATGYPVAGNPYIGCVWDISGVWTFTHLIGLDASALTLELQATTHVLETGFMTGLEFAVIGGNLSVLVEAVYVDIYQPMNVILVENEGFVDNGMRSLVVSSKRHFSSMKKVVGLGSKKDLKSMSGIWKDQNNIRAKLVKAKKPWVDGRSAEEQSLNDHYHSYWFLTLKDWFPITQLNRYLFLDDTSYEETVKHGSTARYFQYGFRGLLDVGGKAISIVSPGDGLSSGALVKVLTPKRTPMTTKFPTTEKDVPDALKDPLNPDNSDMWFERVFEQLKQEIKPVQTPYVHRVSSHLPQCKTKHCRLSLKSSSNYMNQQLEETILRHQESEDDIKTSLMDTGDLTEAEALQQLQNIEAYELELSNLNNQRFSFSDAPYIDESSRGRRLGGVAPGLLPAAAESIASHVMSTLDGGNFFGLEALLEVPKQILFGYSATINSVFFKISMDRFFPIQCCCFCLSYFTFRYNLALRRMNFLLTLKYPLLYSFAENYFAEVLEKA